MPPVKVVAVSKGKLAAVPAFCIDFISFVEENCVVRWFWWWPFVLQQQVCLLCQAHITAGHSCLQFVAFVEDFPFDFRSFSWVFFLQLPELVGQGGARSGLIL